MELLLPAPTHHYEVPDFESLFNTLMATIPDEPISSQLNGHSQVPLSDLIVPSMHTNGSANGLHKQQVEASSEGSGHSHSSDSSYVAPLQDFTLTDSILEPFLKTDQPVVSFPSHHHTGGVELYAFGPSGTQKDSKASSKAEKNRSAQKRFRERQKEKLSTLQEQFDTMSEQLTRLTADNQKLRQRSSVLDRLVKVTEEHILSFDQTSGVKALGSIPLPPMIRSHMGEVKKKCDSELPRTQHKNELDEMRKLSPEMFIFKWKEYLKQVSALLLHTETANPDEVALDQISYQTCDVAWMCKHVSIMNQDTMNKVLAFNLEEGVPSAADDSHWANVVKLLHFTDQQVADMRMVLDYFNTMIGKLQAERQVIIQEALALGKTGVDTSYAMNSSSARDQAVHDKLAKTLRKQHGMMLMFKCFFFGQLLTLTQFAKAAVYSYPYFPDAVALMNATVNNSSPSVPLLSGLK